MEMQQIIEQAEQNIRQALLDYGAHTNRTEVIDDVTDEFISALARDSSYAKQPLRELFSKSPVWDEKIDALVINGTRTHDTNYNRIRILATQILSSAIHEADSEKADLLYEAIDFFADSISETDGIEAINQLAPRAYAPNKKLSRVFKALCVALGVADETAGSEFQRLYAQFADELTAKKIGFKLYVSINPAHFLTMSNPKDDNRGSTLTSCHSFNSTEYEYNCGCAGYARDEVSFIVFTVDDPSNPETLNNRKTTRQIFAYKPGNGLLMQSRMYNTSGGTEGAQEESELYRDLVQREISMLEGVPNLWKTSPYCGSGHENCIKVRDNFGGYADWTYPKFDGKVSFRADHENDYEPLTVGTAGLCIRCGCEISRDLYCEDCDKIYVCDDCDGRCSNTYRVIGEDGNERWVCGTCRVERYDYCAECENYYPRESMHSLGDGVFERVCSSCLEEHYEICPECDEYYRKEDMMFVYDNCGDEVRVCEDCCDEYYFCCDDCTDYYHIDSELKLYRMNGEIVHICEECADEYSKCPHCDELIELREDGTCPCCEAVIEEENKEAESA